MAYDNTYSRIVFVTKLALPLVALGLLSVMFFVSGRPDPDDALAQAPADVEQRAAEQRLTDPWFAGMSDQGETFSVKADVARPDRLDPRKMTTEALSLAVNGLRGDNTLFVRASQGQVDTGTRTMQLSRNVSVRSSLDFALTTDQILANFDQLEIFAPSMVKGTSPLGTIQANQMRLTRDEATDTQLLVFEGDVSLLYQPDE